MSDKCVCERECRVCDGERDDLRAKLLATEAEVKALSKKLFDHEQERAPLLERLGAAQSDHSKEIVKRQDAEAALSAARDAWNDFRFRLVNIYGGPSPYLRAEEMDIALHPSTPKTHRGVK